MLPWPWALGSFVSLPQTATRPGAAKRPRSVRRSCGESRNMGCVAMRRTSPWSFLPFCDLLHFMDSFLCMSFFGCGGSVVCWFVG